MAAGAKISLVVAAAENGVIGRDGALPWHIASDLRFFRRLTLGKPVIMGRKTFESIGKPLDGRANIVITRSQTFEAPGADVVHTLADAIRRAETHAATGGLDEIMVIGGAQVYAEAMEVADRIYLTRVHAEPRGDATFAVLDPDRWTRTRCERHQPGPRDDHPFSICIYDRI